MRGPHVFIYCSVSESVSLHFRYMTAVTRVSVPTFFRSMSKREIASYFIVFIACFLTAKLGEYLFYNAQTSPAILWPPFGIALGAILVGGYRMWFPVALAELFAIFTSGAV